MEPGSDPEAGGKGHPASAPRASKKRATAILGGIFFAALIFSVLSYLHAYSGFLNGKSVSERVFYFASYDDDRIFTEVRYLPAGESRDEELRIAVNDLVAGPMTNRYKRLFSKGAKVTFSFLRDGVYYVGLSRDALFPNDDALYDIRQNVRLLKTNVTSWFPDIPEENILVYIDWRPCM